MRITFLTHFPGRGGSTSMLLQMFRYFREAGHEPKIITGADCDIPILDEYTVFEPTPATDWRKVLGEYRKLVERSKPDVVYVVSGMREADLLRFLEIPRVQHIFTVERHEFLDSALWVRQRARYWEACSANTLDVFSFVKRSGRFDGVELDLPYNIDSAFQQGIVPSEVNDPIQICLITRLERFQKRVMWLPDIIGRLRQKGIPLSWHVYGEGPAGIALKEELRNRGITEVFFHGWRNSAEMALAVPKHDILFSCSRFEGLPVSMIEAMFCGLACVVPALPGGIQYILQHGGGFGYFADSPKKCVDAIVQALANKERLAATKHEALEVAHRLFGAKVVRTKYEALGARLRKLDFNGRSENLDRAVRYRNVSWWTYVRRKAKGLTREG